MCPSDAAIAISLGPTNPGMITIAQEPLIFRREGISPSLRLLVPTFLLPYAPPWVTPLASTLYGILSYHSIFSKENQVLNFGIMFSPDYFRCEISGWVSCYAFFKWWLLLSQHPHCQRNITSLRCTERIFRDLNLRSGLFPFWPVELRPHGLTAKL